MRHNPTGMPRPSLRYRLARLTGGRLGAPSSDLAASLRVLRLDRREFCRRIHLDGWRRVGEMQSARDDLRLEIDPFGPWPVALRAAAIFARARIVGDAPDLTWGRELLAEVLRREPQAREGRRLAGVAPLDGAHLRLRCERIASNSFRLYVDPMGEPTA